jgi:hypothetical protein
VVVVVAVAAAEVVAEFVGMFVVTKLTKLIVCTPTVLTASLTFLATP